MRNDAGTVGTTDCRNRKSRRPSGWRRGTSGSGLSSGIHTINDDRKIKVCTPKWRSACSSAAFTTTGVCVTITTRLNTIVAGMKRER